MKASFVTLLFMALFSQSLFAHGMSKPGPNGGYIRMPGSYHIELVSKESTIKIFFLDMTFKPLAITDANVSVTLKEAKNNKEDKELKKVQLTCNKEEDSFLCNNPEDLKNYEEITVESSVGKENKAISRYRLPLKLQ